MFSLNFRNYFYLKGKYALERKGERKKERKIEWREREREREAKLVHDQIQITEK